jgi:hypothetical protein
MKPMSLLLAGVLLCTGCNNEKTPDDPEVLKAIVSQYFDGIKNRDINALNALTTTDFVLFEDGKVWTNDSLVNALNKFKYFDCAMTFEYINVNVDQSSGAIVYLNHGDVTYDTTKVKIDWLENATFRKVGGTWKLNFLHSTVRK